MEQNQLTNVSLKDLLVFVRFPNLLLISLFMWAMRIAMFHVPFARHGVSFSLTIEQFNFLILDTLIVTVIGYWANDWADRDIDRINRPDRLIVKRNMTLMQFNLIIWTMSFLGAALTLYLAEETHNLKHVWIYPAALAAVYAYARWFKRMGVIGNLLVSALIAALPALVLLAEWPALMTLRQSNSESFNAILYAISGYALLMFLSNLSREMVKDVQDEKGDKQHGVMSFSLLFGQSATRFAVILLMVGVVITEVFLVIPAGFNWPSILFGSGVVLFCVWIAMKVLRASKPRHYAKLSLGHKLLMLCGVLQLLFL